VSSAKSAKLTAWVCGVSLIYRLYTVCAGTESCGIPACISLGVDSSPSTKTLNILSDRYQLMNRIKFTGKCKFDSLYSKPGCHVVSKAFSVSKNTAAVDTLLLKFRVI
jgi:hypothetical protein